MTLSICTHDLNIVDISSLDKMNVLSASFLEIRKSSLYPLRSQLLFIFKRYVNQAAKNHGYTLTSDLKTGHYQEVSKPSLCPAKALGAVFHNPQSKPHQWPNFTTFPVISAETSNRPKLQIMSVLGLTLPGFSQSK